MSHGTRSLYETTDALTHGVRAVDTIVEMCRELYSITMSQSRIMYTYPDNASLTARVRREAESRDERVLSSSAPAASKQQPA